MDEYPDLRLTFGPFHSQLGVGVRTPEELGIGFQRPQCRYGRGRAKMTMTSMIQVLDNGDVQVPTDI